MVTRDDGETEAKYVSLQDRLQVAPVICMWCLCVHMCMSCTCAECAALRADDAGESIIVKGRAHAPNIAAQGAKSLMRSRLHAMHVLKNRLSMAWA